MPSGILVKTDEHTLLARKWVAHAQRLPAGPGPEGNKGLFDSPVETENASASKASDEHVRIDMLAERVVPELRRITDEQDASAFRLFSSPTLTALAREARPLIRHSPDYVVSRIIEIWGRGNECLEPLSSELLSDGTWEVVNFLATRIHYLGPLRKEPQVVYSAVQAPRSGFVGNEGEFTAAALHTNKDRQVVGPELDGDPTERPLREAPSEAEQSAAEFRQGAFGKTSLEACGSTFPSRSRRGASAARPRDRGDWTD
jgi:hypothetical protein